MSLCSSKQRQDEEQCSFKASVCDPVKVENSTPPPPPPQCVSKRLGTVSHNHTVKFWLTAMSKGGRMKKRRKERAGQRGRAGEREKGRGDECDGERERAREIWDCCLLHCERYLSISITLQWWRVASAWGIVWDQLNLRVPANLITPPKFNHATGAREDLMRSEWHIGASTPANRCLYVRYMIAQHVTQQHITVFNVSAGHRLPP